MTQLIGARLKALREQRKLSQHEFAHLLGFEDPQTFSAIETGERRISADQLVLAVEKLGKPLDYFTDPFMLVGEGRFFWRHTNVGAARLAAEERRAGRWIAAFRTLAPQAGRAAPLPRLALGLTRPSSCEAVMLAGERFAAEFKLGDIPAARLAEIMDREFGILVLMVDLTDGISAAACRLPELDVVLINRHEAAGRRHFGLAHQLFHILTWDAVPPIHSEDASDTGESRAEKLADHFASAVLMPAAALDRFGDWPAASAAELPERLAAVARELRVTTSALIGRLVALDRLKSATAMEAAVLRHRCREQAAEPPPPFSRRFVEALTRAIEDGRLSVRRAARLLDLTIEDISDLCAVHGVADPVGL